MSDSLRQLLQAIRDEPDDDDARLVLADWYEESGDLDRATFVRLQLERASLEAWDPQAVHLELRERALLRASDERWRADLPRHQGVQWGRFSRGLVEKVAFDDVALLAEHGAECAEACPIHGLVIRWPRLDARPALAPIASARELTVIGTLMQPDDMAWLANSPLLATIHTLNLVETQMDAEGLERLLASPYLGQLRALRMPLHNFGNAGVERLVQASMPALVDLDLSVATQDELGSGGRYQPTMDAEGVSMLAAWPGLSRVRALNLTGNQIGLEGLRELLSSPNIVGLKALRLRSVSDWDWERDARPDVLPAFERAAGGLLLDELDIGENELSREGARALADAPALRELKVLGFDYMQPGEAFATLAAAPWLDSIRVLSASDCVLEILRALLQRSPKQLHTLRVASTYYWSRMEGIAPTLASAPPLPSLLALDLDQCAINDEELSALGEVTTLPNLIALRIGNEDGPRFGFSDGAARDLARSPLGARLLSLETYYEHVDRLPPVPPVAMGSGVYTGPLRFL